MILRRSLAVLSLVWLAGCGTNPSAMNPAGPQSGRMFDLSVFIFSVAAVVWILVMIALFAALFRRARRDGNDSGATRTVTAATAVTVVILFVWLITSAVAGRSMASSPSPKNELNINVIGHQWWWEFHYTNGAPFEQVVTANEIHIPVGQPVRIHVTSHDVIHSFWVPNLYGKLDLIPDHMNTTWFQADHPGTFRGQCAEFCGLQHANMVFYVVAEPPDKFEKWLNDQRQPSVIPQTPAEEAGRQVFLGAPCVLCHTIRGTEAHGTEGPDLTHLASRQWIGAGTLPNTRGNLSGWVVDAQRVKPGTHMPGMNLHSDQVDPLVSYLGSLR